MLDNTDFFPDEQLALMGEAWLTRKVLEVISLRGRDKIYLSEVCSEGRSEII